MVAEFDFDIEKASGIIETEAADSDETVSDVMFPSYNFGQNCLQLMMSRNTAIYRYHGIFCDGILSSDNS